MLQANTNIVIDPLFRVDVIEKSLRPQRAIYAAMHQDYSEHYVYDEPIIHDMTEEKAGEIILKRLLKKAHFGPCEHTCIVFSTGYFPHSVMQQARTHRVACSFDVQSGRYTSKRILELADKLIQQGYSSSDIEQVFYLRQPGFYTDRQGDRYEYTTTQRNKDIELIKSCVLHYKHNVCNNRYAEEQARGLIPFDIRQHFVVSFNVRSLMHFLDMRFPLDAQYEIRQLCELMWPHFEQWVPDIAHWYAQNRKGKNKLAP